MKKFTKKLIPIILGAMLFSAIVVTSVEATVLVVEIDRSIYYQTVEGVTCEVETIAFEFYTDNSLTHHGGLHSADCVGMLTGDVITTMGFLTVRLSVNTSTKLCSLLEQPCIVYTSSSTWPDPLLAGYWKTNTFVMLSRGGINYCFGGGPTNPESADRCGTRNDAHVCWSHGMGLSSRTGTEALGFVSDMGAGSYRQGTNSFGTLQAGSENNQYIEIGQITDPPVSAGQLVVTVTGRAESVYYGPGQDNQPALKIMAGQGVGETPDLSVDTSNGLVIHSGQTVVLYGSSNQTWPSSDTRAYFGVGGAAVPCCLLAPWMLDYHIDKVEWKYLFNGQYYLITLFE